MSSLKKTKNIRSRFRVLDGKEADNSINVNTFDEFDLVSFTDISHLITQSSYQLGCFAFRFDGVTADFIGPSITSIVN